MCSSSLLYPAPLQMHYQDVWQTSDLAALSCNAMEPKTKKSFNTTSLNLEHCLHSAKISRLSEELRLHMWSGFRCLILRLVLTLFTYGALDRYVVLHSLSRVGSRVPTCATNATQIVFPELFFVASLRSGLSEVGRAVYSRLEPVPPHGVPKASLLNLPLDEVADCSIVLNLKQTTPFHWPIGHRNSLVRQL